MWYSPLPHQRKAVRYLLDHPYCTLMSLPGTGKTTMALSVLKITKEPALIIAPLQTVLASWPGEFDKWAQFRGLDWAIAHGKDKESAFNHKITLINPAGLAWLYTNSHVLKDKHTLIVDEGTTFKTWSTKQTKYLRKLVDIFNRRHLMTGTPTPNNALDWFAQQYIVDMGESFGKFITHFRKKYFYPCGYENRSWAAFEGTPEKLAHLARSRYYVAENENLSIPGTHFIDIEIQLPDDARKVYKQMESKLVAAVNGDKKVSKDSTDKYNKLRQIAAGGLYDKKEIGKAQEWATIHLEKAHKVASIINDLAQPVVVMYRYKFELPAIVKALNAAKKNIKIGMMNGDTPVSKKRSIESDWNSGKYDVLMLQPMSASHGLNLQHGGKHMIWATLDDSAERYAQTNKRLSRIGTKEPVIIYRLIVKGTVEKGVVFPRLEQKESDQDYLVRYCKRLQDRLSEECDDC
jgi:SNF2 family DNA or RNA helicase